MTEADARFWLSGLPPPSPSAAEPPPAFVRSPQGAEAWVEPITSGAILHIRDSPAARVRDYPLEGSPDRIFGVIDFVAGGRALLGVTYYASSGTMTDGPFLILLDPQTGSYRELGIRAHTQSETLASNPVLDDYVAVVPSDVKRKEALGACSLVMLQVSTDDARCVGRGDGGVPVWSPDGTILAYNTPDRAIEIVALGTLDQTTTVVTSDGEIAPIAWVDAAHLIYVTYPPSEEATQASAARSGELWLLNRESGTAMWLADRVAEPRCYPKCDYHSLVVYLHSQ
ncbi:hypothetical protein SD80_011660 [Scytonema tolypothrichoides VB-61278]|nr:hypothetical protein SD80_011660 [Scytonema tolypothrichoides VB-61278]